MQLLTKAVMMAFDFEELSHKLQYIVSGDKIILVFSVRCILKVSLNITSIQGNTNDVSKWKKNYYLYYI